MGQVTVELEGLHHAPHLFHEAALSHTGEGERVEKREAGLHRQNAQEQEGGLIDPFHAAPALAMKHRRVHDAPGQVGKSETQETGDKECGQRGAEPNAIGTQLTDDLERLAEGFPVQPGFGQFDTRLVVS